MPRSVPGPPSGGATYRLPVILPSVRGVTPSRRATWPLGMYCTCGRGARAPAGYALATLQAELPALMCVQAPRGGRAEPDVLTLQPASAQGRP